VAAVVMVGVVMLGVVMLGVVMSTIMVVSMPRHIVMRISRDLFNQSGNVLL